MKKLLTLLFSLVFLAPVSFASDFKDFRLGFNLGSYGYLSGMSYSLNNFVLNQTTDLAEMVLSAPATDTITAGCFRYGARVGTPPTYRISMQNVSATTGVGDGTILASQTFTPPADTTWNATWQCKDFAASYGITRGQIVAIVVDYSSGTVDGSNNSSFTTRPASAPIQAGLPYAIEVDGGVAAKKQDFPPFFAIKSASRAYGNPYLANVATVFSKSSSPNEWGVKFSLPTGTCGAYKVSGIGASVHAAAAGKTINITLYGTDGTTPLQQIVWDADIQDVGGASHQWITMYFPEATLSSLVCGPTYRIGFAPQDTGAASFAMDIISAGGATELTAFTGEGTFYQTTRTDTGAWTDDNTSGQLLELIISDMTSSTGGGSFTFAQ